VALSKLSSAASPKGSSAPAPNRDAHGRLQHRESIRIETERRGRLLQVRREKEAEDAAVQRAEEAKLKSEQDKETKEMVEAMRLEALRHAFGLPKPKRTLREKLLQQKKTWSSMAKQRWKEDELYKRKLKLERSQRVELEREGIKSELGKARAARLKAETAPGGKGSSSERDKSIFPLSAIDEVMTVDFNGSVATRNLSNWTIPFVHPLSLPSALERRKPKHMIIPPTLLPKPGQRPANITNSTLTALGPSSSSKHSSNTTGHKSAKFRSHRFHHRTHAQPLVRHHRSSASTRYYYRPEAGDDAAAGISSEGVSPVGVRLEGLDALRRKQLQSTENNGDSPEIFYWESDFDTPSPLAAGSDEPKFQEDPLQRDHQGSDDAKQRPRVVFNELDYWQAEYDSEDAL